MSLSNIIEMSRKQFTGLEPDQARSTLDRYLEQYSTRHDKKAGNNFYIWFYLDCIYAGASIKICDIPTRDEGSFTNFEIVPMAALAGEAGHGACEDERKAEFWSVLANRRQGYVEIAECSTKEMAVRFRDQLDEHIHSVKSINRRTHWRTYTYIEVRAAMAYILYQLHQDELEKGATIIERIISAAKRRYFSIIIGIHTRTIRAKYQAEFSLERSDEPTDDFYTWYYISYMKRYHQSILDISLPNVAAGELLELEVKPVAVVDLEGGCEPCDEDEADFWSVYVRPKSGDSIPLACCSMKVIALALKGELEEKLQSIKPGSGKRSRRFTFTSVQLMQAMALLIHDLKENSLFTSKTLIHGK
jgi:hypothetical protein